MYHLYLQSFWKFYTSRMSIDLASHLESQQHHCRMWLSNILRLAVVITTRATSLRSHSLANICKEPAWPQCFRTRQEPSAQFP